jgi:hypothetical protein
MLTKDSKQKLYQTYICPALEFSSIVWMMASDNVKERIRRQQIKFAMLIYRVHCDQSSLYQQTQWLPIDASQLLRFNLFIRDVLMYKVPKLLHNKLIVKPSGRTRAASVVTLEHPERMANLRCADNLFAERACEAWNSIDDKLRAPDIVYNVTSNVFRTKLRNLVCTKLSCNHRLK